VFFAPLFYKTLINNKDKYISMQKDYDKIKEEIRERIKLKETLLEEQAREEKKRKEVKELLAMERAIETNINKKNPKFSEKLINYFMKHPVESVFYLGAILMLFQREWLLLLFCLVFPIFVPGLMRKKDEKRN
jgi:preprotein translocase subunit SecA